MPIGGAISNNAPKIIEASIFFVVFLVKFIALSIKLLKHYIIDAKISKRFNRDAILRILNVSFKSCNNDAVLFVF